MTAQALDERVQKLIETAKKGDPSIDGDLIWRAYRYAQNMHGEQTRESGEPYIIHPIEVATILADMQMDQQTICAALLARLQWRTPRPAWKTSRRTLARTWPSWWTA